MSEEVGEVLEQLLPDLDGQHDDWGDVLERSKAIPPAETRSYGVRGRARRGLPLLMAVGIAAAVVLAVTSPWGGGPSILQRANAAITSPWADGVLYYEAETVGYTLVNAGPLRTQVWLQEGGSHQAVAIVTYLPCPAEACYPVYWETGGSLPAHRTLTLLRWDPTRNLLHRTPAAPTVGYLAYDPLATVRDALEAGTARVVSRGTLAGRHVITIDVPIRDELGTPGTATYTIDAKTYRPIRVIIHHVHGLLLPLGLTEPHIPTREHSAPFDVAITFVAYDYLPATAHNLALANIHARHPTAKITDAPDGGPTPVGHRFCKPGWVKLGFGGCVRA